MSVLGWGFIIAVYRDLQTLIIGDRSWSSWTTATSHSVNLTQDSWASSRQHSLSQVTKTGDQHAVLDPTD